MQELSLSFVFSRCDSLSVILLPFEFLSVSLSLLVISRPYFHTVPFAEGHQYSSRVEDLLRQNRE